MTRVLLLIAITASVALATENSYADRAWFHDGTGLEIFAETTGSTQVSAARGMLGFAYGPSGSEGRRPS